MKYFLSISLLLLLLGCKENPRVVVETELGDILIEVYQDKAPVTTNNFLKYVNEGRYDNAVFYRVVNKDNQEGVEVKIDVIQGGLFEEEHPLELKSIIHESTNQTGVLHEDGTISMARLEPGSASSEFFICIGNQPELDCGGKRNSDGKGFAAFGKVIRGMDVVRKIWALSNTDQLLDEQVVIYKMHQL
ncbi:peptidylprolyl isomerase [Carboxylicivirga mesophila]|uniref:Peptidyl-prolyl cis-trans isomerase n=1 Tax=Carboxylicivirga mesophila TaxID=1166478 RepID=A0ABS5KEN2_9BACT|nr:peptidylprolyl isomerase [Carboxylicivirga mesophila]MBS2213508.1 peptidylprolyl isomerase [Carboxylicivirga mesophila]